MFISGPIGIEDLERRRILIKCKIATFSAKIYCRLATLPELMHTNFIVPEYADEKPEFDITLNEIPSFFSKTFCHPRRQKLQTTERIQILFIRRNQILGGALGLARLNLSFYLVTPYTPSSSPRPR
jgi:hypothetical protein